ncbi:MAG: hypothetical protein FJX89_06135 [Bacteroidetes bacterium]|nr:hypothetical protein [Bacteroidota bacterium]
METCIRERLGTQSLTIQKKRLSVDHSHAGNDYPSGLALPDPPARAWQESPAYAPYRDWLFKRPEYKNASDPE